MIRENNNGEFTFCGGMRRSVIDLACVSVGLLSIVNALTDESLNHFPMVLALKKNHENEFAAVAGMVIRSKKRQS